MEICKGIPRCQLQRCCEPISCHVNRNRDTEHPQNGGCDIRQLPTLAQLETLAGEHERHEIRRVRRVRADAVRLEHLLRVAVIGRHEAGTFRGVDALDDPPE